VSSALTTRRIAAVLRVVARALAQDFVVSAPLIRVAGLNPHAGEEGHFGDEEERLIRPAIAEVLADAALIRDVPNLCIRGPEVPDVVFRQAVYPSPGTARTDAVVAMYHDQGLIPIKLLDFDEAVNITLGLPILRTSPDHGVAHDIAGTGQARLSSMAAALRLVSQLAR
jgi:4-hydroxythreonine-4-phosphate dehydrogenase